MQGFGWKFVTVMLPICAVLIGPASGQEVLATFRGKEYTRQQLTQQLETKREQLARMPGALDSFDEQKQAALNIIQWAGETLFADFEQQVSITPEEVEEEYAEWKASGRMPSPEPFLRQHRVYKRAWDHYSELIQEEDLDQSQAAKQSHQILLESDAFPSPVAFNSWQYQLHRFEEAGGFCCFPLTKEEWAQENKEAIRRKLVMSRTGEKLARLKGDMESERLRSFVEQLDSYNGDVEKGMQRIANERGYAQLRALILRDELVVHDKDIQKAVDHQIETSLEATGDLDSYRFLLMKPEVSWSPATTP